MVLFLVHNSEAPSNVLKQKYKDMKKIFVFLFFCTKFHTTYGFFTMSKIREKETKIVLLDGKPRLFMLSDKIIKIITVMIQFDKN